MNQFTSKYKEIFNEAFNDENFPVKFQIDSEMQKAEYERNIKKNVKKWIKTLEDIEYNFGKCAEISFGGDIYKANKEVLTNLKHIAKEVK